MRWPKITLSKHGIINYERRGALFSLSEPPNDAREREEAMRLCDEKISSWLKMKRSKNTATISEASVRYAVLKASGGKCELCGIPASLKPIDIDHIVPRAKANKSGKVLKDNRWIDLNHIDNLQALCFTCNRAKRATDQTDFRRKNKLVRDYIPDIIRAEGRTPDIRTLKGSSLLAELYEKLIEEHSELILEKKSEQKLEELADMVEVIFAISSFYGANEERLLEIRSKKHKARGGFSSGYLYCGDKDTA